MSPCPCPAPAADAGATGRRARRGGPRGDADGAPGTGPPPPRRQGADSLLPRISGVESEADDSEDSDSSCSALAITDEEKLKLAALLRDVDQDEEVAEEGYHVDAEVRRDLEHIDGRLQELVMEPEGDAEDAGGRGPPREPRGATRQQRLEDIDRCLQSLADSALEDVEPLSEEAVRSLLQDAARDAPSGTDPELISALLDQARRELPRFRYRHGDGADHALELPPLTNNTAAS
ncbi:Fibrous sheath-interacting protein 1 [Frankliniella fusca]|uniref:Fibrous sheath-interacting protein 1 n=1 Tax=Frankliniella fusca TaxID=407009 RepID=A0AAE1HBJ9_9NEOP|nr:Fibrous sheath-interacting protein 1 [Frankliniella fusca]